MSDTGSESLMFAGAAVRIQPLEDNLGSSSFRASGWWWWWDAFFKRPQIGMLCSTHSGASFVYLNSHTLWYCQQRSDISASAKESTNKLTACNINQVYIFQFSAEAQPAWCIQSSVFVCWIPSSLWRGGMSHSATQAHSVGGATNIHSRTSSEQRPANHISYLSPIE